MNNLILEMKRIVDEAKMNNLSNVLIRNHLKEYLHYFVLDFIYNSEFKDLIFYGGSCLRIIYDLPRMSEDLDFEADENIDFAKLAKGLENHFKKDLKLQEKFSVNKERSINRIVLVLPIMSELGLSPHQSETLRIKVEIRPVSKKYLDNIKPIFSPLSRQGKSFVVRHYDLSTLFASKLGAILDRPKKGFTVGSDGKINFKGRDFYDLIWYMEKRILPNEQMFKVNEIKDSVGEVFDKISLFISQNNLELGLKKDLEVLFDNLNFVENFVASFRSNFERVKSERYSPKKINQLNSIKVSEDFHTDDYFIEFTYLCEGEKYTFFLFKLSYEFISFAKSPNIKQLSKHVDKINFVASLSEDKKNIIQEYATLLENKIDGYLKRHNNEVYFDKWRSKNIRMTDKEFNPEKDIVFSWGESLASDNIKLEDLSL